MRKPWLRSNGIYYLTLPNGDQLNLGKDKKRAYDKWHKIADGKESAADMKLKDVFVAYEASLSDCTEQTRDVAKRHLAMFLAFAGNLKVSKLIPALWTKYRESKDWASSTQRTALNKILAALNYAVDEGKLDSHPFKIKKKPAWERREAVLTLSDQKRLEDAAYPALRAFLIGLRESGCRPSELCNARIEHCNLDESVMLVPNKTKKKTGLKYRPVYLSDTLKELIRELSGHRTEGHIWLSSFGEQLKPSSIQHKVRKLGIKLGLPAGTCPYVYRHTFASRAINDGDVNPALVAKLLGHVDMNMIKVYFKSDDAVLKRAVKAATQK